MTKLHLISIILMLIYYSPKFKADLSDTNTKFKAALENSVHVSNAQFDKEFKSINKSGFR